MHHVINPTTKENGMRIVFFLIVCAILLFPTQLGFSQYSEKPPTLGVEITNTSPFTYKDESGRTVIIGEVENKKNFPVTAVKIWAGFYDEINDQPLESTTGGTTLDIIPPFGKSTYMIKSQSANSKITNVSVNLLGFNSSPNKQVLLSLEPNTLTIGNNLSLTGKITNKGPLNSTNTKIHLIAYDVFKPPRVVGLETIVIKENLQPGISKTFEFSSPQNTRASAYKLIAESDNYQSSYTPITSSKVVVPTKLIKIDSVYIGDSLGNKLSSSEIVMGKPVYITSQIRILQPTDQIQEERPYIFYVQIKQFGKKPITEFIGFTNDAFQKSGSSVHFPTVEWIPEHDGGFWIETYVWDPNAIPLTNPSPIVLALVGR